MKKQFGFTLLEILVVTAIISVLVSAVYFNFGDARNTSHDKAMMTEFQQMQTALALYKAQHGTFPLPSATTGCGTPFPVGGERFSTDTGSCVGAYIRDLVAEGFIAALPAVADSKSSNCGIEYRTDTTGTWYKLTAIDCIAGNQIMTADDPLARCPSSCGACAGGVSLTSDFFTKSFAVYSNGGQCE